MSEFIQREPDPTHTPVKGDRYISRYYGVTLTIVAVGEKDGQRWVVGETPSGVSYKYEYELFVTTRRRVIQSAGKGRR